MPQALPADASTPRAAAKADRRQALLAAAERLFAEHGYEGVRLEDLGAACGISGPGIYRHFSGKSAVLGTLLVRVSQDLLDGGEQIEQEAERLDLPPEQVLARLTTFQTDFALDHRDIITVQWRERRHLDPPDAREVSRLQRTYIAVWARQLLRLHPHEDQATAVFRAQAAFGLINSTPHSVRRSHTDRAGRRRLLAELALAALVHPGTP
ncbi:TetR/AcrR family transcriptional regulator [Micrococcus terreus]|uniref:Transcriptional regulator, TetR family n=1 Tax=Micrococcus terreus TaxID=574650 RepID=A0A1I7MHZ7_9MICC|nr:TetR/AcrR family transcriptional regulator [Micrococcus terreus]SFV21519.1 transcriptional regulator, TetR family [Micrococcus terreus]